MDASRLTSLAPQPVVNSGDAHLWNMASELGRVLSAAPPGDGGEDGCGFIEGAVGVAAEVVELRLGVVVDGGV